ncbi:hypothetical protein OAD67_02850 [bacterium]|nr:hypothetical protein [bacterium]
MSNALSTFGRSRSPRRRDTHRPWDHNDDWSSQAKEMEQRLTRELKRHEAKHGGEVGWVSLVTDDASGDLANLRHSPESDHVSTTDDAQALRREVRKLRAQLAKAETELERADQMSRHIVAINSPAKSPLRYHSPETQSQSERFYLNENAKLRRQCDDRNATNERLRSALLLSTPQKSPARSHRVY